MKKTLLVLSILCLPALLFSQWIGTAPTINGSLGTNEYGTHTNGQNQQLSNSRTWYMTWNDTALFVFVSGAGSGNRVLMYFDVDPITPINGGTSTNGTLTGVSYSNTQLSPLPFRADAFVALETGYRQLNQESGGTFGTGINATSRTGWSFSNSGSDFEVAIPWSDLTGAGRPSSFAWCGYVTDNNVGGNYFSPVPTENVAGVIGTTGIRYERYYIVNNTGTTTNDANTVKPFSRNSYVFNSSSNNNSFGAISVYDFTMNSNGLQISRGNTGGNWTIAGTLTVNDGSIYFGSPSSNAFGTSSAGNVTVSGGRLDMDETSQTLVVSGNFSQTGGTFELSNAAGGDMSVTGNWTRSNAGTTFNPLTRLVNFNGSSAQTITISGGGTETFDYLTLSNTTGVSLGTSTDLTINQPLSISASVPFTIGANTVTLNSTISGTGTITGSTSSNLNIGGSGALGTMNFTSGARTLNNLTLNRTTGSATLGSDLTIDGAFTQTTGSLEINGNTLTINGTVSRTGGFISGSTASNLSITGSGALGASIFMNQSSVGTTNRLNNFTVNRTGGATITLGNALQVQGVVTHTSGTIASTSSGFLQLKAPAAATYGQIAGTGSGDITGTVTSEFYIDSATGKWRQICSPFSSTTLADINDDLTLNFGTPNSSYTNVWYLDESQGGSSNAGTWRAATDTTESISDKGYSIYVFSEQLPATLDISGTYSNADYTTPALTRTGSITDTTGFHLIRNAWPSGYNHNTTVTNLQGNTIYVYNGSTAQSWNGTVGTLAGGVIPPFHAFFVEVSSNNATLTFPTANRSTTAGNYMDKNGLDNYVALKITSSSGESDETYIYTQDGAKNDFEINDGRKWVNGGNVPSIYTKLEGQKIAFNLLESLPVNGDAIPLGFTCQAEGTFTASFTMENIPADVEVVLEDLWTGNEHLLSNGVYTFDHKKGITQDRFLLTYRKKSNTTGVKETAKETVFVGSEGNTITLSSGTIKAPCTVEVYDMMGRLICPAVEVDFSQTPIYSFSPAHKASGYYIVKIYSDAIANNTKVFLP